MRSKAIAALAAALMVTTATVAPARSAQPLSIAHGPAVSNADETSDLGGRRGGLAWILGLVVIGVLVFVIVELGKDNTLPTSP